MKTAAPLTPNPADAPAPSTPQSGAGPLSAAAVRSADDVLVMIGHELRNPVHALCAALEVLETATPGSESATEAQAVAVRQGRQLARLVQFLLSSGGEPGPELAEGLPRLRERRVLLVAPAGHLAAEELRPALQRSGHAVARSADGIDGLVQLLRTQPDVGVLALDLPGMAGDEVAQHARACGFAGRLVALPAPGAVVDRRALMQAGFDDCLAWPLDATALSATMSC